MDDLPNILRELANQFINAQAGIGEHSPLTPDYLVRAADELESKK